MKVASWNVNSVNVRLRHVLNWLEDHNVDILGLQETKIVDDDFPREAFEDAGYHVLTAGQKTYNGVALLSRHAGKEIVRAIPDFDDTEKRVLAATYGDVRVINLYVPNGKRVGSEKYDYKLRWLEALKSFLAEELSKRASVLVIGDFNIAPEDRDVHDPVAWQGSVLVSQPERDALKAILDLGLVDCFRLFPQEESRFSWWDYRAGAFRRNMGLRIDLILANRPLAERCRKSCIDKNARGWERPSDHAPVLAEFD